MRSYRTSPERSGYGDKTMRTTHRDRCGHAFAALCTALVIAFAGIPAAGALSADYSILPNGTVYNTSVEITGASEYVFSNVGIMGENVPVVVGNVQLSGNCSPCSYNWSRPWGHRHPSHLQKEIIPSSSPNRSRTIPSRKHSTVRTR